MTQLKLNENIPNFILPSTTGETFSYETHQKEHQSWHLIIFFRGAWCPVCVQDLKDLEENKSYFESKGPLFGPLRCLLVQLTHPFVQ